MPERQHSPHQSAQTRGCGAGAAVVHFLVKRQERVVFYPGCQAPSETLESWYTLYKLSQPIPFFLSTYLVTVSI